MRPEEFQADFGLSDEQREKFSIYHDLLQKWQRAINLVSAQTTDEIWSRHFADSAQLVRFIDNGRTVIDWGSGAGFPGMVLAIMRSDLSLTLIDSDAKKTEFLKTVSRETKTKIEVKKARLESLNTKTDIVTARALAPLNLLLEYMCRAFQGGHMPEMLLLKGREVKEEIAKAGQNFKFEAALHPSRTDKKAMILQVRHIKRCE